MGITKKFLNMFKSGTGEEGGKKEKEEAQLTYTNGALRKLPHSTE